MLKIAALASVSFMISGCSLLPTISPEAHARYVCRGNGTPQISGVYRPCGIDRDGRPSLRRQEDIDREFKEMLENQSHNQPLFDTDRHGNLAMDPETQMLSDMSVDAYQGNASLVVRDAFYQDRHTHKNHQHMDNVGQHENELNSLQAQISQMQEKLNTARMHKNEHDNLEASFTQHRQAW